MQKGIDKLIFMCYNIQVRGGIAQLARATGSYPVGHGFKSNLRYHGPLVKRLRHRPFTAVTGVRFSHGSPIRKAHCKSSALFLLVTRGLEETTQCDGSSVVLLEFAFAAKTVWELAHKRSGVRIFVEDEILPRLKALFFFREEQAPPLPVIQG